MGPVSFSSDADQLSYDPSSQRIFVEYGDGAIGIIDPQTWKRITLNSAPIRSAFSWMKLAGVFLSILPRKTKSPSSTAIQDGLIVGSSTTPIRTSPWHLTCSTGLYSSRLAVPPSCSRSTWIRGGSAYFGQVGKHNSLYLAVPGLSGRGTELWVYETRD